MVDALDLDRILVRVYDLSEFGIPSIACQWCDSMTGVQKYSGSVRRTQVMALHLQKATSLYSMSVRE